VDNRAPLAVALYLFGCSKTTFEDRYQSHLTDARNADARGKRRFKRFFYLNELRVLKDEGVQAVYTLRKELGRLDPTQVEG
jgi:hypothetical protein